MRCRWFTKAGTRTLGKLLKAFSLILPSVPAGRRLYAPGARVLTRDCQYTSRSPKQFTPTAKADEAEGGKQASRHRSVGDSASQPSVLHIPSAACQVGSHGALSRGSCADRERR